MIGMKFLVKIRVFFDAYSFLDLIKKIMFNIK